MTSLAPAPPASAAAQALQPRIGLAGLATMGQNLALNIAEKGFPISVYNRTAAKVDSTLSRAAAEGGLPVLGHRDPRDFVLSLARPRTVVLLVQAGRAVDATIDALSPYLDSALVRNDGRRNSALVRPLEWRLPTNPPPARGPGCPLPPMALLFPRLRSPTSIPVNGEPSCCPRRPSLLSTTGFVAAHGGPSCCPRRAALLSMEVFCDMHYVDLLSYLDFFDTIVLWFCCFSIYFLLRDIPVMYPAKSVLIQ